ncbi:integrin alpha, partial [Bathymodiolus thermophilus thioautotrophic gill symbiont]
IASGTGGFVINGESAWDESGFSVSSAGDVNGDGLDDLIVGVYMAKFDGKVQAGKSYVVFGKADGAAVDLSTIASGTGGFVINGENAGDYSGYSVSSAGDVNGDGLDDLIIGAYGASPDGSGDKVGRSFVIFGKTDTTAVNLADISAAGGDIAHTIDFQGDANTDKNDTLTGTSADELFIAGLGNDVLTGNGGTDVFNAGAGDDTIIINADNLAKLSSKVLSNHLLARVDGGGNTDTLKLAGTDLTLDLTQIDNGRIQDIEIIDLTGSGDTS